MELEDMELEDKCLNAVERCYSRQGYTVADVDETESIVIVRDDTSLRFVSVHLVDEFAHGFDEVSAPKRQAMENYMFDWLESTGFKDSVLMTWDIADIKPLSSGTRAMMRIAVDVLSDK